MRALSVSSCSALVRLRASSMDVMISTVGMCLGGRAKLKPSKSRGLGLCEFLGG